MQYPLRLALTLILSSLSVTAAPARVIILGFDGVDPRIVSEMISRGELPNLAALKKRGTFTPLRTSNPPQSPTAWSSFTTCKNPGAHGVYDFLRRDPARYLPGVGFGTAVHATLKLDGALDQRAHFNTIREGKSFWKVADEQGARVKALVVPFAYPAEDLAHGCMLCGLGVPDIRGTTSTYYLFSEELADAEKVAGGIQLPLNFSGDEATAMLPGARDPRTREYPEVPVRVKVDRPAKKVTITLPDSKTIELAEGAWSDWLEWNFTITPKFSVRAISRIHVLQTAPKVRMYMTCLQFHPDAPYMQLSAPESYAAELKERYGLYKTIGWAYDTKAMQQEVIGEELFLEDIWRTITWREKLALDELDRGDFDLLVAAWTAPDRVSHMFWRFRDPEHPLYTKEGAATYGNVVEQTYRRMDEIVGKVMAKLGDDDTLMIMSDHGFHSFRVGFNVNTWLIRNGYLAVQGQNDPATAANPRPFLQGYDWSRTKAYSLGLGSIFLNLKGRERDGTVAPDEADALIAELRDKLLHVTDPKTGAPIFSAIYTRHDYKGPRAGDAPDLQLGYADGYQSSKDTVNGSAPAELFEPNTNKWSGEHAASDVENTPGIFFSNKPITREPDIRDIGVTALETLGKKVPADFEGKGLF